MGKDDKKLQDLRDYARTTVLEKENSHKETDNVNHNEAARILNLFSNDILQETKINNSKEKSVTSSDTSNSINLNADLSKEVKLNSNILVTSFKQNSKIKENNFKENVEVKPKQRTQEKIEEKIEEKVETLFNGSLQVEQTDDEQLEKEINTYSKKSNNYKFRKNLITSVFCCMLAILGGWIIGNSIEIASANSQIVSQIEKQEEYSVNIIEYLSKIGKLDDNVNQTPPNSQDGTLFPIDEIIPITPQPLEDTTAYEQESNWFDKICNWIRNLFGG